MSDSSIRQVVREEIRAELDERDEKNRKRGLTLLRAFEMLITELRKMLGVEKS